MFFAKFNASEFNIYNVQKPTLTDREMYLVVKKSI